MRLVFRNTAEILPIGYTVGSLAGIIITVVYAFLRAVKGALYKGKRGRQGHKAK